MGNSFLGFGGDGSAVKAAGRLFRICVRTVHVHAVCSERTLPIFGVGGCGGSGQCAFISDIVCVNSRTLDIGKVCRLLSRLNLVLGMGVGSFIIMGGAGVCNGFVGDLWGMAAEWMVILEK